MHGLLQKLFHKFIHNFFRKENPLDIYSEISSGIPLENLSEIPSEIFSRIPPEISPVIVPRYLSKNIPKLHSEISFSMIDSEISLKMKLENFQMVPKML